MVQMGEREERDGVLAFRSGPRARAQEVRGSVKGRKWLGAGGEDLRAAGALEGVKGSALAFQKCQSAIGRKAGKGSCWEKGLLCGSALAFRSGLTAPGCAG